MTLHKKPTQEELDAQIKASLDAIDNEPTPSTPIPSEEIEEPTPSTPIPSEEPTPSEPIPSEEPTPSEPVPSKEIYKKKFVASSTEAQILYSKNKKVTEAIDKASTLPEPTEDEMLMEYPEWEDMSELERKFAKDNLTNKRKFALIEEATQESRDMQKWANKVDEFISDPQTIIDNPKLDGLEEEFKTFSISQSRKGSDFATLVDAFMWNREQLKQKEIKKQGKTFETPSGGLNDKQKPKSDKISVEESRRLRMTNYKKYTELLRAGKIDFDTV